MDKSIKRPESLQLFQKKKGKSSDNTSTTGKLRALEKLYRDTAAKQQESMNATNTNQFATGGQSRLISSMDVEQEDMAYNLVGNKLSNYDTTIAQGANQNLEAVRALNVQTLNSLDDVSRITQANDEFNGISSQFALDQIERKAFKKYKKSGYNKLSSQFL
jgi:hypothetical protein